MAETDERLFYESPVRYADIDGSTSRFDRLIAAPSDTELFFMWLGWATLGMIVAFFCLTVLTGAALSRKVRKSPFNLYLMFLMVPDIALSLFCSINCILNIRAGQYVSEEWCRFQSFYVLWGIGANAWLNALITRELHSMLKMSFQRARYRPPSLTVVSMQSIGVYIWVACFSLLPSLTIPELPLKTALHFGAACSPVEYDLLSTVVLYAIFLPLFAVVPILYVGYVTYDVISRGLLPLTGKTRNLAIYFLRLSFVFIIMWLPSVVLLFIVGGWVNPWVRWSAGTWSHLQGGASAAVSLFKPDIRKAVLDFVRCRRAASSMEEASTWFSSRFLTASRQSNNASEALSMSSYDPEILPTSRASEDLASRRRPSGRNMRVSEDLTGSRRSSGPSKEFRSSIWRIAIGLGTTKDSEWKEEEEEHEVVFSRESEDEAAQNVRNPAQDAGVDRELDLEEAEEEESLQLSFGSSNNKLNSSGILAEVDEAEEEGKDPSVDKGPRVTFSETETVEEKDST